MAFPTTFDPGMGTGDPLMSAGGSVAGAGAGDPRKKRAIDQIMRARLMSTGGSQQAMQMMMMGGPEYLDMMNQRQMDPMNTWY